MRAFGKWMWMALIPVFLGGLMAPAPARLEERRGDGDPRLAHRGWKSGDPFARMKSELQLTDDQVEKIRGIFLESRKASVRIWADLRVAGIELRQLLTQAEVDKGKVEEKVGQIGQVRQRLLSHRTDTFFKIREVLTPEQRKKAAPFLMRGFLGGHPGRQGMGPGPQGG